MADATYAFRPSKITRDQQKEKGKEMDRVWSFAEAHASEVTPCLRHMLEEQHPGAYFAIDGSTLLVKLDPSVASKGLQARLWTDADFDDVDHRTWVETLAHLALDGLDVSRAGRRWLKEPNVQYDLPEHGGYMVTAYDGGVFLFGSMDEAQARPTLIEIARDPKHPGRLTALWLLLFEATPEAREALRDLSLAGIPREARDGIAEVLAPPASHEPPHPTIPAFTRAELVAALDARAREDREAFDRLTANPGFAGSGAQVLLPADELQVRRLRRQLVARCNQHGLDDYIVLSRLLMVRQERVVRAGVTPRP